VTAHHHADEIPHAFVGQTAVVAVVIAATLCVALATDGNVHETAVAVAIAFVVLRGISRNARRSGIVR
jgi:uncharacterized membrane protein